jgi:hypothetical protein
LLLLLLPLHGYGEAKQQFLDLPITDNSDSKRVTYNVPLDRLKVNNLYKLTCSIANTENSEIGMIFEPRLLASSPYGNVALNDKLLTSNTGNLQQGKNTFSFRIMVGTEDKEKYNRFNLTSLSGTPIQITECIAHEDPPPATVNAVASKAIPSAAASSIGGGSFFVATNATDHLVTIAVGNLFPKEYQIDPHSWKTVFVSTDNQNIEIRMIK